MNFRTVTGIKKTVLKGVFFYIVTLFTYCSAAAETVKSPIFQQKGSRDTITVINKNEFVLVSPKENKAGEDSWQKNMPWIAALLIGILTTGANIVISRNLKKTSLENTKAQLENATKLSLAQIETSRKNNERDFNKTVLSGNMQIWSNDFRDVIIKILAATSTFKIKGTITDQEFEAFRALIIRAELMLNLDKDGAFITALHSLQECFLAIQMSNQSVNDLDNHIDAVKIQTQAKLEKVWEKVKLGL